MRTAYFLTIWLLFICMPSNASGHLFSQPHTITKRCTFDGYGATYNLTHPLTIGAHATLRLKNTVLTNVSSNTLMLADQTSKLILDNCILILSDNYHFTHGTVRIYNMSELRGPGTWFHTSAEGVIISKNSTLLCSANLLYYYAPTSQTKHGIVCTDQSATLMLHNAHIRAGAMGLTLSQGVLRLHEHCMFQPDQRTEEHGIFLGTGVSAQENMRLLLSSPGARLQVMQPHLHIKQKPQSYASYIALYGILLGIGVGISTL